MKKSTMADIFFVANKIYYVTKMFLKHKKSDVMTIFSEIEIWGTDFLLRMDKT